MRIVVFAGPSIERDVVESFSGVEWWPPVSQGDVFRAAQTRPFAIAIIDGYFDGVPSVWHKEILWAMSQGIHVYGASSMGALRAAELHPFGMRGVGEIFEAYRDGRYEDDDEVAVIHAPAELGYQSLSLPMVNARATIEAARSQRAIESSFADALLELAKSVFYRDRNWGEILLQAGRRGLATSQVEAFERWLPTGERDQKRADALELLDQLAALATQRPSPMAPAYSFEWTVMWDRVYSDSSRRTAGDSELQRDIIDELRLHPTRYREIARRAQFKQLALREVARRRLSADTASVRRRLRVLREHKALYSRADLDQWIAQNDWTEVDLERAMEAEVHGQQALGDVAAQAILDELRLLGDYPDLKTAASRKQSLALPASPAPAQLLGWYFESLLGEPIPEQLDDFLASIGVADRDTFYRLLHRHYQARIAIDDENQ